MVEVKGMWKNIITEKVFSCLGPIDKVYGKIGYLENTGILLQGSDGFFVVDKKDLQENYTEVVK
jgi:hypothetical protein